MLAAIGVGSLDELADRGACRTASATSDAGRRRRCRRPASETEVLAELRALAARNTVTVPMIGLGYAGTVTPPVIRRNVLENPAWYTAYTPYQPEISQGRLEALLTFQTTVADLTGLPVAGASLLDEATAAAEAMTLLRRAGRGAVAAVRGGRRHPAADARRAAHPGRAAGHRAGGRRPDRRAARRRAVRACCCQLPGRVRARCATRAPLIDAAHERGALVAVAADLLALTLLTPPGELGADAVAGHHPAVRGAARLRRPARRVPVGARRSTPASCPAGWSGCPATPTATRRCGWPCRPASSTSAGRRRPRNICTAQVLLAVVAACYAVYHGPDGLRRIARRAHRMAAVLAAGLRAGGVDGRARGVLRHRAGAGARPGRRGGRRRARRRASRCAGSTPTPSASPAPS